MGSLKLTTASSGSVILSPANTASDTTITVPAVTGTMLTSASQLVGNGTTTNDSASTGQVGEFVDSYVSGVTVGTSATNITTISLTAGDWDVSGVVQFYGGGNVTFVIGAINTTSASFSGLSIGKNQVNAPTYAIGGIGLATLPTLRYSLSSTTTLYLIGALSSSQSCNGYISARRAR